MQIIARVIHQMHVIQTCTKVHLQRPFMKYNYLVKIKSQCVFFVPIVTNDWSCKHGKKKLMCVIFCMHYSFHAYVCNGMYQKKETS